MLRNDVDVHSRPSELERVCESCLVPSLPSSRNVYNLPNDVDAHFLPDELERVCESCLVPSLCLDSSGNVCTMHEYKANKTCSGTRLHDEIITITDWHVWLLAWAWVYDYRVAPDIACLSLTVGSWHAHTCRDTLSPQCVLADADTAVSSWGKCRYPLNSQYMLLALDTSQRMQIHSSSQQMQIHTYPLIWANTMQIQTQLLIRADTCRNMPSLGYMHTHAGLQCVHVHG